jgi:hypothetical protein
MTSIRRTRTDAANLTALSRQVCAEVKIAGQPKEPPQNAQPVAQGMRVLLYHYSVPCRRLDNLRETPRLQTSTAH